MKHRWDSITHRTPTLDTELTLTETHALASAMLAACEGDESTAASRVRPMALRMLRVRTRWSAQDISSILQVLDGTLEPDTRGGMIATGIAAALEAARFEANNARNERTELPRTWKETKTEDEAE